MVPNDKPSSYVPNSIELIEEHGSKVMGRVNLEKFKSYLDFTALLNH